MSEKFKISKINQMPKPQVLAFDLDLTIHDAIEHYNFSVNQTILNFGGKELRPDQLEQLGSTNFVNSRNIFSFFLSEELADVALQYYYDHFLQTEIPKEAVISGAREILYEIKHKFNLPIIAVTNSEEPIARKILRDVDLENSFDFIIGVKDDIPYKPDPTMLLMALKDIGAIPGPHVWFVGDLDTDVICARLANCTSIRFNHNSAELIDEEADLVINSHHNLLNIITSKLI